MVEEVQKIREELKNGKKNYLSDNLKDCFDALYSNTFGHPCEYEFGGESAVNVIDGDGEFCNDNCGIPVKDCWKRYFQQLMCRKKL